MLNEAKNLRLRPKLRGQDYEAKAKNNYEKKCQIIINNI